MTPTLPRGRARKLQTRGGRAKFSRVGREDATEGGARGVSPKRTQVPAPRSLLLLLDDLGQAGLGRRRRRRLHPSRAWGRRGRRGAGHAAGISVRLLGAAGLGVLAHGCGQHHVRRDRPGLAAGERARGAARGTGAHWPGSPHPVPLSFPVARRGDAMGGEEAVPAAPPPPPPAGPARPAGPLRGGGQGASPSQRETLGARVVRGALPAAPGRCVLHPPPARPQGPRVGARQRSSTA